MINLEEAARVEVADRPFYIFPKEALAPGLAAEKTLPYVSQIAAVNEYDSCAIVDVQAAGLLTAGQTRAVALGATGMSIRQASECAHSEYETMKTHLRRAREKLGVYDMAGLVAEGFRLHIFSVSQYFDPKKGPRMSPRMRDILQGADQGKSRRQTARGMYRAENTFKTITKRMYPRLNVHEMQAALLLAHMYGWLSEPADEAVS